MFRKEVVFLKVFSNNSISEFGSFFRYDLSPFIRDKNHPPKTFVVPSKKPLLHLRDGMDHMWMRRVENISPIQILASHRGLIQDMQHSSSARKKSQVVVFGVFFFVPEFSGNEFFLGVEDGCSFTYQHEKDIIFND